MQRGKNGTVSLPGLVDARGNPMSINAEEVERRFWKRSPGEYEEAAERLLDIAIRLKKAGCAEWATAMEPAIRLLAEVYVARREGIAKQ